jgi:LysR family transcriptional regulator, hydrogen peroxide-inducible genes activator
MEFHQLRYFVAVAETENFTKAATRCFVSQPSLSQQILNLEEELGQKLFHRLGRRAPLTDAGHVFLESARRILAEAENVSLELRDATAAVRGKVTVGVIPTLAPFLMPQIIDRSRSLYPELEISLYEDFRSYLVPSVVEGELDFAIVMEPVRDARLIAEPLFDEPLLLALSPDHRLAKQLIIRMSDLEKETFALLGDKTGLTTLIQRFCGDFNFEPRVGYRCAQVSTVKALVAQGSAISILPQVTRSANDRRRIIYRYLEGQTPTRKVAIIRHRQRYQSAAARTLIQLITQSINPPDETAS